MRYDKYSDEHLSQNFSSDEFDCKCSGLCKITIIDPVLVERLQDMRNALKKPISINSGYRCAEWNKKVGGVGDSQHVHGKAADIQVSGLTGRELAAYARKSGFTSIGIGDNWIHVDTRNGKHDWRYP